MMKPTRLQKIGSEFLKTVPKTLRGGDGGSYSSGNDMWEAVPAIKLMAPMPQTWPVDSRGGYRALGFPFRGGASVPRALASY